MKEVIAMRAVQVTDDDIAFCISTVCTKLLGRPVKCRTYCDVSEYWGAIAEGDKFSVKELLDLLVAVNADAETCRETIPLEDPETASLGMDLSRGLLKLALGTDWVWEHILDYGLLLIGLPNEGFRIPTQESEIPSIPSHSDRTKQHTGLLNQQLV